MSVRVLTLLIASILAIAFQASSPGFEAPSPKSNASEAKFELDIQPILTARGCNSGPCHGKARGQNGFALSLLGFDADMDYQSLVKDARGRRVFPAAPEQSLLIQKGTGLVPHGGGAKIAVESEDYQLLIAWIRSGMPRVSASDPRLIQIEIHPEPKPLQPKEEVALKVVAKYSDGSLRDVTSTCAYQSNDPGYLSVNAEGVVKAGTLPGEATIMARYMGNIATWSSAIPNAESIEEAYYRDLPRNNFIDGLAYDKLAKLHLKPSEPCTDSQFLRRAYLDVIGRLPSSEEARRFLMDGSVEKRSALIDDLLNREEYTDFWANKWADLLRPNPYRVGIKATMTLDQWIRDAFRKNMPYDQFVAGLLTAQGSTFHNGAVTIFRDRRQPEEIVTMASQLFMGIRLECAKCHQHPFEVYGQKDFYSLAAYFGRVGYKGTGLSPPISGGEESILVKGEGQVRHPLTQEVLLPKPLTSDKGQEIPKGEDPREYLMRWLTESENPYFAQVAVNRVWADLFGMGLVDPVDDMRATNPPSNPALLQALAKHFREVGYDQKALLKTILSSRLYALSSGPNASNRTDLRNYSRHYRQRMRAEVLADAIADVTLVPDDYAAVAPGSRAMQLWTHRIGSEILDAFGRPDPNQDPPCERTPDSTVVQALHLMNAPAIQKKVTAENGRCRQLAQSETPIEQVLDELYLTTYSRFPTEVEKADLLKVYDHQKEKRREFIEDVMWSLINSPEFLYKD